MRIPNFSVVSRPVDLGSVRDADLARLRAAAAATDVPGDGVAGLPAAGRRPSGKTLAHTEADDTENRAPLANLHRALHRASPLHRRDCATPTL